MKRATFTQGWALRVRHRRVQPCPRYEVGDFYAGGRCGSATGGICLAFGKKRAIFTRGGVAAHSPT
ncbi:MAG: hypothetical protein LBT01_09485 [Spirochaetaceae bacterium]|nr:hypothetical protein [Spirochaetaceae bacterium]